MNQVNSPLVSVVIPYFNCEKYIVETLDSVEKQTYPHVEIIVVNDGSSAASTEYLEEVLQDKTNILYLSQTNQGVSSARNTGAKVAQGEFLLFLDADDKIASQYLQTAVNIMLSKPTCKLVYSNVEFFGEKVGVWNLPQYTTFDKLLQGNMIYCTALHRKSDFTKLGGFDEDLSAYEDWDYWIRLLQNGGEVIRIDEILFSYRKRNDGTSLMDSLKKDRTEDRYNWQKIYLKHNNLYMQYGLGFLDLIRNQKKKKDLQYWKYKLKKVFG